MIIKLKEYERIFQIISAVIESEDRDPAHSCIDYSLFGANILADHFQLNPKVRCGLATFHLGEDDQVLCFGEVTDDGVSGTPEGFHCWVEANGWVIDFMAPRFRELKETKFTSHPKMFQKKLSEMAQHPNDMTKAGDFFFSHEQELADSILPPICEHLVMQDLANLCSQWFKKPPKKIPVSAATVDKNGKMRPVQLKPASIRSNW